MNQKMKITATLALVMLSAGLFAQKKPVVHNYQTIKASEWEILKNDSLDFAFDTYSGQKALLLKRKVANSKGASVAYPKGLNFKDGTIELDIASPNGTNGFVGFAFHIKNQHRYETLYFRPGSSGTINAVQYMPEKKDVFNWWDYEADKYQSKATLPASTWFHVKAVVNKQEITVFVNNRQVMVYKNLDKDLASGPVGFWLGNCPTGAYKNLVVTCTN